MSDENSLINIEEDQNVRKTSIGCNGSPVFNLSKQLQILNLGEDNKSKGKNSNFLSAPLQSIENVNSESKRTQSNAFVSDFNSLFPTTEDEDADRNVLDEFSEIDAGFELSIDTFLADTIKPSSSKRSLTDLESLMSDAVHPERSGLLTTPPKSTKYFSLNTNSVDDVLSNDLLCGPDSWENPFDNYFSKCSSNTEKTVSPQSELFISTSDATETVAQTTYVEENSGQFLLRIATPYRTKTIPVRGLDSEESEYLKKRDLLMQSDKKLYEKIEGEKVRGKGRSLVAQMDEAFKHTEIPPTEKESTVVPMIRTDESENVSIKVGACGEDMCPKFGDDEMSPVLNENKIEDSQTFIAIEPGERANEFNLTFTEKPHKTSPEDTPAEFQENTVVPIQCVTDFAELFSFLNASRNTTNSQSSVASSWNDDEFNRIRESIKKDLEMLPQKSQLNSCENAEKITIDVYSSRSRESTFVPHSECRELEGKRQVTFALSDEIIQPSATSRSDCSQVGNNSSSFEPESSREIQEVHLAIHTSGNAESNGPIASDSESEDDFQSLSSSVTEETPFIGGTPLAFRNSTVQLENSWLNFSYNMSPSLEETFCTNSKPTVNSPPACTSISDTVLLEESESDLSDSFESVNSTIPNMRYAENDETTCDVTPTPEDESLHVIDLVSSPKAPHEPNDLSVLMTTEDNRLNNSSSFETVVENEQENASTSKEDEPYKNWDNMDTSLTVPLSVYMAAMKTKEMSLTTILDDCSPTVVGGTPVDTSAADMSDERNSNILDERISESRAIDAQLNETVLVSSVESTRDWVNIPMTKFPDEALIEIRSYSKSLNSSEEYSVPVSHQSFSTDGLGESTEVEKIDTGDRKCFEEFLVNVGGKNYVMKLLNPTAPVSVTNDAEETTEMGSPEMTDQATSDLTCPVGVPVRTSEEHISCMKPDEADETRELDPWKMAVEVTDNITSAVSSELEICEVTDISAEKVSDLHTLLDAESCHMNTIMIDVSNSDVEEIRELKGSEMADEATIYVANVPTVLFESENVVDSEMLMDADILSSSLVKPGSPVARTPTNLSLIGESNSVHLQEEEEENIVNGNTDNLEEARTEDTREMETVLELSMSPSDTSEASDQSEMLAPIGLNILSDVESLCAPEITEENVDEDVQQDADGMNETDNDVLTTSPIKDTIDVCHDEVEKAQRIKEREIAFAEIYDLMRPHIELDDSNLIKAEIPVSTKVNVLPYVESIRKLPDEESIQLYLSRRGTPQALTEEFLKSYFMLMHATNDAADDEVEESQNFRDDSTYEADLQNSPKVESAPESMARTPTKLSPILEKSTMNLPSEEDMENNLWRESSNGETIDVRHDEVEKAQRMKEREIAFAEIYDLMRPHIELDDSNLIKAEIPVSTKVNVLPYVESIRKLPDEESIQLYLSRRGTPQALTEEFLKSYFMLMHATNDAADDEVEESQNFRDDSTYEADLPNSPKVESAPESMARMPTKLSPILEKSMMNLSSGEDMESDLSKESLNKAVCNTAQTNPVDEIQLFEGASNNGSPFSANKLESMEAVVIESSPDISIRESPIDERHLNELEASIATEAFVRSPEDVPAFDVQVNKFENMSIDETEVLQMEHENCVQTTFDNDQTGTQKSDEEYYEPLNRRTENQFTNIETQNLNCERNTATVDTTILVSEERMSSFGVKTPEVKSATAHTEDIGANGEVQFSTNFMSVTPSNSGSPGISPIILPNAERTSPCILKFETDGDTDADTIDEVANSLLAAESEQYSTRSPDSAKLELLDTYPSDNTAFTPKMPRSQTGSKGSSAQAAKLRASLDRLLTPLRENINRLRTPMSVTRQNNLNCSPPIHNAQPFFTLEPCEDGNKTRVVVELPVNLLDMSVTALDNMFGQANALTLHTESNTADGIERDDIITGKAESCSDSNDSEMYKKLQDKYEKLKSISSASSHNEAELKRAFDQANECIRVLENRYEMLKDYCNRYICYMNEEYEKLETELKQSNNEREKLKSELTQIQSAKKQ